MRNKRYGLWAMVFNPKIRVNDSVYVRYIEYTAKNIEEAKQLCKEAILENGYIPLEIYSDTQIRNMINNSK